MEGPAAFADPWVGVVLGGTYRLLRQIGRGGVALIYEATHARVPRRFAVKILRVNLAADAELRARFEREARIGAELGHDHIVEVIDFDYTSNGEPYLVMELLEGKDLQAMLAEQPVVPLEWGIAVVRQTAIALEAAHGRGVIHRDLKPENIFLCGDPRRRVQAKVMDFGLSKILGSTTVVTSTIFGTPWYMAPEQASGSPGEITVKADVYALGVILYELLTGRLPFDDPEPMIVLDRLLGEEPRPLASLRPDLPAQLTSAVQRALAKNPFARPGLGELTGALEAGLGPERWSHVVSWGQAREDRIVPAVWGEDAATADGPAADPLLTQPLGSPPSRSRAVALLALAAVVVGVGAGLVFALGWDQKPRHAVVGKVPPRPLRRSAPPSPDAGPLALAAARAGAGEAPPPDAGEASRPDRTVPSVVRPVKPRRGALAATEARLSVTAKIGRKLVTAEVFLDGTKIGETPLRTRVKAGARRLEARRGAARQVRRVRLVPGQEESVVFQLP